MPEGDTVFLAGHRLADALTGRVLLRGQLRHPRFATADLAGREVLGVRSVGKHLFTRFSGDLSLHSHFRMDGAWHLYRPGERWRRPGHQARAVFEVPDRQAIGFALHDLELLPTADEHRLVGHLGPDLLADDWDGAAEAEAVRRLVAEPERELGLALLDQRVLAGVGNLYKAEVCFLLGVSPWSPVSAVDPVEAVRLCRRLLLANAWRPEQSTTGSLRRGQQHWVFERTGRPCARCGTRVRVGGQGAGVLERVAYWCPRCQPGPIA
ncbi:DNA-formamidopyrimidine glycosylase family protein [Actinosynnema pretiosum]|uniref:DNA-(apurinic or apyrimidinic site) lyase n=1 Tax=Actinosynnema pretiosum TaxID=42197 RepID=A0A290ZCF3_9PSEU|nr:DNA-formamidopyrimidine glycosylase family protein [Actinosynnema pretiosum]ATE56720.1 DNA glycosylase [Actinosynnema pretiosum]